MGTSRLTRGMFVERESLVHLHNILNTRYSAGELQTLCFYLGVEYDSLPGEGKENKARELIKYLDRRGRILELIKIGKLKRPDIPWDGQISEPVDDTISIARLSFKNTYSLKCDDFVFSNQWCWIIKHFGEPKIRQWRMVGSLIYLVIIILFIYVTLTQLTNNLTILYPYVFPTPNRIAPLVYVPLGLLLIAIMLTSDILHLSHFTPWEHFGAKKQRLILVLIVVLAVITFAGSMLVGAIRFDLITLLPSSIEPVFFKWMALIQSLILIPVSLIFILIFRWGLKGILVLWLGIIATINLILRVARFVKNSVAHI